ncbi:MAG: beta-galactosidase [Caldilineaceae bacterium SB0661_bin_32]|uniref:Beta-galactosidase n=1 Tax=Caldilineaceae bacterium SB0661_bin_32 TaxID=2605255 RepID=A0A6B1D2T4_9CHLR|nr:beta-galactosidase [Caldilineaceae bacterium SB0661_bin_32]
MSDFLRYRQIHLDFHTSEQITNIGGEFDAGAWAQQLIDAHVDSITCFARGHHGMIFYDTHAHPERRHPHLQCNLLKEQIEAAHAREIRVPIYTTIQWDYYTTQKQPQWLQVAADGSIQGQKPYEAGFYAKLCLNTPYVDFLRAHVDDMFACLPAVDGLFFDIVQDQDCSCPACRHEMLARGIDPASDADRQAFGQGVTDRFKRAMSAHVRSHSQDCTIFYNSGHVGPRQRAAGETYSHWELESLPSGGWGYMHFPLSQRYARTTGHDSLGMTGKFHTAWGDFQSYKNEAALQFECFQMLALNAKCSIGDQLHPTGRLDRATYDLVGPVYREVARREPWCRGVSPLTDIGVFTLEEFTGERLTAETVGAVRMLQEGGHQFDVVDSETGWDGYRVLILPDAVTLDEKLARKVSEYIAGGGKLIASFESGLTPDLVDFALPGWGVRKIGEGPVDANGGPVRGRHFHSGDYVDYLRAEKPLAGGLRPTEYVMYMRGLEISAGEDAEVLARVVPAYFDRTWQHFCSHRQTPSSGELGAPAAARTGDVIYFAHPIFRQYHRNAPHWCKQLLLNALDMLLPDPILRHGGPTGMLTALNEQNDQARLVLHLLHYVPERRGQDFDVIEDVLPLYDVDVSLKLPGQVAGVRCVPDGEALAFSEAQGRLNFTVPKVEGRQIVEIALG